MGEKNIFYLVAFCRLRPIIGALGGMVSFTGVVIRNAILVFRVKLF